MPCKTGRRGSQLRILLGRSPGSRVWWPRVGDASAYFPPVPAVRSARTQPAKRRASTTGTGEEEDSATGGAVGSSGTERSALASDGEGGETCSSSQETERDERLCIVEGERERESEKERGRHLTDDLSRSVTLDQERSSATRERETEGGQPSIGSLVGSGCCRGSEGGARPPEIGLSLFERPREPHRSLARPFVPASSPLFDGFSLAPRGRKRDARWLPGVGAKTLSPILSREPSRGCLSGSSASGTRASTVSVEAFRENCSAGPLPPPREG